ncbi:MAG: alanine racemase [Beggiatoa sp. IS2]|nr:MAG: alanine racemase [Beggiatoa sp. IS2]
MSRPIQAIIDLIALRTNVQRVRTCCVPEQRIIAVIKANAYGHGACQIAQAIATHVEAFAVSCLEEALELRESGVNLPIMLLEGFFQPDELPIIVEQHLQVVIHTPTQIDQILRAKLGKPLRVWLKIDTGMHRLGFAPQEMEVVWKSLQQCSIVAKPLGLISHLACADDRGNPHTIDQIQRFAQLTKGLECETSLANSAGILGWLATFQKNQPTQWVRPGIMLYGVSPFIDSTGKNEGLQPVMQLQSSLISVKQYRQGDLIGYAGSYRCPQAMPVGVVAAGYADGYPRHAPSGTPLLVNGRRTPLIGRVSMDMLTVDLRSQPNARVGDPVVLWGRNLPAEEIASHAGTIAYELFCNVSGRVKRVERT